jgi:hypothetical protein
MKRAVLLLAALASSAGCHLRNRCDAGDVTLYWDPTHAGGFVGSDGVARTCQQAGVASVAVYADGNLEGTFACTGALPQDPTDDGIVLTAFFPGAHDFDLRGLDGNGNELYIAQQRLTVYDCQSTTYDVQLSQDAGDVAIGYTLPGGRCTTPSGGSAHPTTYMELQLRDASNGLYFSSLTTGNQLLFPCGSAITLSAVPFGTYTLAGIQEVEYLQSGNFIVYNYNCTSGPFSHRASGDGANVLLQAQAAGGQVSCF